MKLIKRFFLLSLILTSSFLICCSSSKKIFKGTAANDTQSPVRTLGTYAGLPRLDNGRADISKLISQLNDLNVNTYNWLIWQGENDWDDLKLFLPLAKKHNIAVWVTLVPPTESKPKARWNSEPYGLDYIKWSEEVAKLSLTYPNLIALSIDDFVHNLDFYTPDYVGKMIDEIDKINPNLNFIPCAYYSKITQDFANKYGTLIDALLFPYRASSDKRKNLQNSRLVGNEIAHIRSLFKEEIPIYIDVYLTAHSSLGSSTPLYVEEVIKEAGKHADGILIYTHPNPSKDPEKYKIVKEEFLLLKSKK